MINIKNYLYTKHGILIKDSEAFYFNYLQENHDMMLDKVLETFLENCSTRYYSQKHIHDIRIGLIKEAVGRNKRTPDGKGDAGNITRAEILEDEFGLTSEETIDPSTGKTNACIEDEENNSAFISIDQDEKVIYDIELLRRNLTRQN